MKSIESAADKMISPLQDLEDNLHFPINFIVIPLFAFANAGIDLSQMSIGDLFSGVGLAVMVGLVVGNIPLLYVLNKDWFHTLIFETPGKIVLGICGIVIVVTYFFMLKFTKPVEFKR